MFKITQQNQIQSKALSWSWLNEWIFIDFLLFSIIKFQASFNVTLFEHNTKLKEHLWFLYLFCCYIICRTFVKVHVNNRLQLVCINNNKRRQRSRRRRKSVLIVIIIEIRRRKINKCERERDSNEADKVCLYIQSLNVWYSQNLHTTTMSYV